MIREKLVILGGTGSGIIVADAAKVSTRAFDVIGFLNDREPRGVEFFRNPGAWELRVLVGLRLPRCISSAHFRRPRKHLLASRGLFHWESRTIAGQPLFTPPRRSPKTLGLGPEVSLGRLPWSNRGWSAENTCASGAEVTSATTSTGRLHLRRTERYHPRPAAPSARAHTCRSECRLSRGDRNRQVCRARFRCCITGGCT
jgi:hypothetical protein